MYTHSLYMTRRFTKSIQYNIPIAHHKCHGFQRSHWCSCKCEVPDCMARLSKPARDNSKSMWFIHSQVRTKHWTMYSILSYELRMQLYIYLYTNIHTRIIHKNIYMQTYICMDPYPILICHTKPNLYLFKTVGLMDISFMLLTHIFTLPSRIVMHKIAYGTVNARYLAP